MFNTHFQFVVFLWRQNYMAFRTTVNTLVHPSKNSARQNISSSFQVIILWNSFHMFLLGRYRRIQSYHLTQFYNFPMFGTYWKPPLMLFSQSLMHEGPIPTDDRISGSGFHAVQWCCPYLPTGPECTHLQFWGDTVFPARFAITFWTSPKLLLGTSYLLASWCSPEVDTHSFLFLCHFGHFHANKRKPSLLLF